MADIVDNVRQAVTERVELPGMSLMEHLAELRTRIIQSAIWLLIGFAVAWVYHVQLFNIIQAPAVTMGHKLIMLHPTDAINLYIRTALYGGLIIASPFILYQLWLFIAPAMYQNEKKFVIPFMLVTVFLFGAGAYFGYRWVMPGAIHILVDEFGKNFQAALTIEDYTNFFLAIVVGLGACFEMPVIMFFLAFFGIMDGKFMLRNFRYAVLAIFIIAAVLCPTPDPIGMCLFASPMLVLYFVGVAGAYMAGSSRKKRLAV